MDTRIQKHFQKVDPVLYDVVMRLDGASDRLTSTKKDDYFTDLCEAIINQQLSEKAGSTIYKRFVALFPGGKVLPEALVALSDESIRGVGTSWNKVRFLKSLAKSVIGNEINFSSFETLSDEEVVIELTKLHGIGPWTAEMFLMFSLGRPDVFSLGDVGLKRAIQRIYKLKKEPTPKQLKRISRKWSPYRTHACRILWKSLELPK
jgi:DNA-3-methyladenine glycosylase II